MATMDVLGEGVNTLDEVLDMRAMLVAIANGPSYGGGMQVAPDARFDDGLLDVLIVRETSIRGFLKVFPRVFNGTHVGHDLTLLRRARRIRLQAPGLVTYADGERFPHFDVWRYCGQSNRGADRRDCRSGFRRTDFRTRVNGG